jgi:oligosaccharide repeat unit polymerase
MLLFLTFFSVLITNNISQRAIYFTENDVVPLICGIVAFNIGYYFSAQVLNLKQEMYPNLKPSVNLIENVRKIGIRLVQISIFGYITWIIVDTEAWFRYSSSGHLRTIPGITTFTQFLPVGVGCLFYVQKMYENKIYNKAILFCVLLVTYRTFINNERLALLEVLIPLGAIYLYFNSKQVRSPWWVIYSFALIVVFSLFALTEYFRSWQTYKFEYGLTFTNFIIDRFISYYGTALNNGAIYQEIYPQISNLPLGTLDWLWQFPVLGSFLTNLLTNQDLSVNWSQALKFYAGTDEYNNINSYFMILIEANLYILAAMFLILGGFFQIIYSKLHNPKSPYIIVLGSILVGILELPRLYWFGLGRAFPIVFSSMLIYLYIKKIERIAG